MGTVLCNQSMQDLENHYSNHGTRLPFIRGNKEATESWIESLLGKADTVHDLQPLALVKDMTEIKGIDRLTAPQVVTAVSNFEGEQSFHGMCCSHDGDGLQNWEVESVIENEPSREHSEFQPRDSEMLQTVQQDIRKAYTGDVRDFEDLSPTPVAFQAAAQDSTVQAHKENIVLGSRRPLHELQPYVEECLTEIIPPLSTQIPGALYEQGSRIIKPWKHPILEQLDQ
jgi:hypothetical protein